MTKVRVLVVGQTPPPYHGQSIMIENLVNAEFKSIEIIHLRMTFSRIAEEVGRFNWKKLPHLFRLILQGTYYLLLKKVEVLYYPPAGPMLVPVLRDILLLPFLRIFAPRVIYHFRAGGVSEFLESQSGMLRLIGKHAYGCPDAAIVLSDHNPKDGEYFRAKRIYVIPNGVKDVFSEQRISRGANTHVSLFYVGLLTEEKGLYILLQAFRQICQEHNNVSLHLAGEFDKLDTRDSFLQLLKEYGLQEKVKLYGLLTDDIKWELYGKMDIMCFLSHYRAETFGNVVLEAMMWGLPVVAARWRGVQDLVIDGYNGYLVPLRDPNVAAERLGLLITNPELRNEFGNHGRERFLKEFTLEKHLNRMEQAILETAATH